MIDCASNCTYNEFAEVSGRQRTATRHDRRAEREKEFGLMRFEDKVVLITGGGGGIGRAAARRFMREGASVVLNGRRQEVLDAAKEELDPSGERVELFAGDASKRETAKAFVAAADERFGGVDVLVNPGIFRVKPFEEENEKDFEEALDSILRPTFYASQAAVPEM